MNAKRFGVLSGGAVLAALVVALAIWFLADGQRPQGVRREHDEAAAPAYPVETTGTIERYLYFADATGRHLEAEPRQMPDIPDAARAARSLVQALIDGPRHGGTRTLPGTTGIRDVYLTPDGVAYVDFSRPVTDDHPGGVQAEVLSVYSVANTLVLNLADISAVKILIEGAEALTLAGHVDLRPPYNANMLLIK